jgi:hypothetical protein
MRGTQSRQTAVILEPVLHAFDAERGTYEESTFFDPSWSTAKGAVMTTDICDIATSARAIGRGELVSEKSHKEQVGPSLVGLGEPTKTCPEGVCCKQLPTAHYGIGPVVLGGWVLQNPLFNGFGGVQAYLPEKDLAIAAEATADKKAKVGVNGGMEVFKEVASERAGPPAPAVTSTGIDDAMRKSNVSNDPSDVVGALLREDASRRGETSHGHER